MPYQPTHPHPYLESIDVTGIAGNVFSVVINPKDIITKYNLSILSYSSMDIIYTTGDVVLDEFLYGTESGVTLPIVVPPDSGMVNGDNYRWQITLYDTTGDSVVSPFYYFSAKKNPDIIFNPEIPTLLSTCEYTFVAEYSQEQSEKYMYYKYSLYRDGELIDETPEKMDSLLSYTYRGFISNNLYRLDLEIVMPDRRQYKMSRIFSVMYETQDSVLCSNITQVKDENCLNVDYSQNLFIKGDSNGEVSYSTYLNKTDATTTVGATIPDDISISYSKINETRPLLIDKDFTLYYNVHFSDFFTGNIIKLTDSELGRTYNVRYDSHKFYYQIGNSTEVSIDPYVDENVIHQEKSAIHDTGTSVDSVDDNTLYMLYPNDAIYNDSVFLYNDIASKFWWTIVLLPDKVLIYKGEKYSESVVS